MQPNDTDIRPAIALLVAPLALLLIATFAGDFVLIELLVRRLAAPLLLAAAEALALVGTGVLARHVVARLLRAAATPSEPAIDFLLGFPLFGAICFLIGLGRISGATMALPLAILAGIGALALWKARRSLVWPAGELTTASGLALLTIGAVFALAFLEAQAPPISLDELSYHLAVPRIWINEGRAVDLPLLSHSYFPLGIESADLPLLTLLGDAGAVASHLLRLAAALSTTIVLFRWMRGGASGRAAMLATAAIVATPALAITAGWSLVEWPLVGICTVTAIALDRHAAGEPEAAGLLSAAIAAGLMTKYTFIPFALLAIMGTWTLLRKQAIARRPLLIAMTIGCAAGSMFLVRNLILTGNPLAPFLTAGAPHVAGFRGTGLAGYVFNGHFIDEALGATLVSLALIAIVLSQRLARTRIAIAVVTGALLISIAHPSSRILLPFLVIPAAAAAAVFDLPSLWGRRLITAVFLTGVATQLFLLALLVDRDGAFSLLAGRQTETQYAASARPSIRIAIELDRLLPPRSRTLIVGLNELYPFRHAVRGGGNFDGDRISRYLEADSAEGLRDRLTRDGIDHIAIVNAQVPLTSDARKLEERSTVLSGSAERSLRALITRWGRITARTSDAVLVELR